MHVVAAPVCHTTAIRYGNRMRSHAEPATAGSPPKRLAVTGGVLRAGLAVLGCGCVAAVLGIATAIVDGGQSAPSGVLASLLGPLLFLAYWGIQAWLIDAGAGMLGCSGRRREFLAASGLAFATWIGYSLVALAEAAVVRWLGSGSWPAIALALLTLPVLFWFLALIVRRVRAVYDIPTVNAFALALLPFAAVAGALVIVVGAAGVFRG